MRAVDTVNGQLSVDLIVKVEGEDKILARIRRTARTTSAELFC